MEKFLNLLNIHPDKNQKWLLISMFVSGLLITYVNPTLTKAIISELPAQWLAIEALVSSIAALIIGMIWKGKIREKAIKWFFFLTISESLIGCMLAWYLAFIEYNVWIFAIVSLIYTTFITMFVEKCIMAFKTKLWNEKAREVYDNNSSIVYSIVCITGFTFALLMLPSLKLSLFLWGCCAILDDIGWIIVYYKNQNILKEV